MDRLEPAGGHPQPGGAEGQQAPGGLRPGQSLPRSPAYPAGLTRSFRLRFHTATSVRPVNCTTSAGVRILTSSSSSAVHALPGPEPLSGSVTAAAIIRALVTIPARRSAPREAAGP